MTFIRPPAVEGIYYPADAQALENGVRALLGRESEKRGRYRKSVRGVIVPHDSYDSCGETQAAVFGQVEIPNIVILLGPNHRELGAAIALDTADAWQTPLGRVAVQKEFSARLMENCPRLRANDLAHLQEHALEVQLPFLQCLSGTFQIVPILLGALSPARCHAVAIALTETIRQWGEPSLIVVSANLSHEKDKILIEKIIASDLESPGLASVVLAPVVVLLQAVRRLEGVKKTEVLLSATGYAGILI